MPQSLPYRFATVTIAMCTGYRCDCQSHMRLRRSTNVARHANASATEVSVSVGEDLVLRVTDDGTGLGQVTCGSGLRNLQHRAECLGGTFAVNCHEGGGTCVEWRIPLRV